MTVSPTGGGSRYVGKVALVTGRASGIGEAIIRRLLAKGASVVADDDKTKGLEILSKELANEIRRGPGRCPPPGGRGQAGRGDRPERATRRGSQRRWGRPGKPIVDHSTDDWSFALDACHNRVFVAMKHEGKLMTEAGRGGASLNISTAPMGSIPGVREAYNERVPLKRAASPDEIAAAALFLSGADASCISGVKLLIDGVRATGYPDPRPHIAAAMAALTGGQQ